MLFDTLRFLIKTLSDLFILVVLLRFYLQLARAPFQHPLAQFVMGLTNFAVLPLRRKLPSVKGYDTATLTLAWGTAWITILLMLILAPVPYQLALPQTWLLAGLLAVLEVFKSSVYLLMGAVLVMAVLSWVSPYNPLTPILDALTRPYLQPFRRFSVSNIDLSPLILMLILQVILMLPVAIIERLLLSQLPLAI